MLTDFCIWLSTRGWKGLVWRVALTYVLMLPGVLGVDLINLAKCVNKTAVLGYGLLFASYGATARLWSRAGVKVSD